MTNKRTIIRDAVSVAVLSMMMAVVFATAWESVYDGVTEVESELLELIPAMDENLIQFIALFGLGLFLTWVGLLSQDARKRLQGTFIFVGSILVLLVLALFGVFLPNIEPTLLNGLAFLSGITVAVSTELFEWRYNDYRADLLNLDFSESNIWGNAVTTEGEQAQFPAARRGVMSILGAIAGGANAAVIITADSIFLVGASMVVSVLFLWRLLHLLNSEVGGVSAQILGPTQSGKTLFFYGIYTVLDESDDFDRINSDFSQVAREIDETQLQDGTDWGIDSTNNPESYFIDFAYDKWYWKSGTLWFTDYPGQWLDSIFRPVSDGGKPTEHQPRSVTDGGESNYESVGDTEDDTTSEEMDIWSLGLQGVYTTNLQAEGVTTPSEILELSEEKLAEILPPGEYDESIDAAKEVKRIAQEKVASASVEAGTELDDASEESIQSPDSSAEQRNNQPGFDSGGGDGAEQDRLERVQQSLRDASKIICIIDTEKAIKTGSIDAEHAKGNYSSDGASASLSLGEMNRICNRAQPEEVILVATKADLLIPQYKEDKENEAPHKELGDFDEFKDWVRQMFESRTFPEFDGKATDIYPVYHQSKVEDEQVVPDRENNEVHAEGFEEVLKQITLE